MTDFKQILAYLYAKNLQLGILVNFRADSLQYKRIINSKCKSGNYNSDKFANNS